MIVGDIETLTFDFKNTLPTGETIERATFDIIPYQGTDNDPAAMIVSDPVVSGSRVSIRVKAITPDVSYWPRMTAHYTDTQIVTLPDPGQGSLRVVG